MEMSKKYKTFLKNELKDEASRNAREEDQRSQHRIREDKVARTKQLERDIEESENQKNEEIRAMKEKTEKAIEDIKKKETHEEEECKKLIEKIEADAKKEQEEKLKVFDEIIEKTKNSLKVERLENDLKLLDTDCSLKKLQYEVEQTVANGMENVSKKREELAAEEKVNDRKRHEDILKQQDGILEEQREKGQQIAEKREEYSVQNTELQKDLENGHRQGLAKMFNMLTTRYSKYYTDRMNRLIESIQKSLNEIMTAYEECLECFEIENMNERQLKRTVKSFEDFRFRLGHLSQQLTGIDIGLIDVEDESIRKEKFEKIRKMQKKMFPLRTLTSKFCGRFKAGNTKRDEGKEEELDKLMQETCELFNNFGNLDKQQQALINKLTPIKEPLSVEGSNN